MKNEELRIGIASQSSTLTGEAESFMTHHRAIGNTSESIGGKAAQFFILNS